MYNIHAIQRAGDDDDNVIQYYIHPAHLTSHEVAPQPAITDGGWASLAMGGVPCLTKGGMSLNRMTIVPASMEVVGQLFGVGGGGGGGVGNVVVMCWGCWGLYIWGLMWHYVSLACP